MIAENVSIITLILKGNNFGDKEAKLLAEGIKKSESIESMPN
jgi:hypothetical protein